MVSYRPQEMIIEKDSQSFVAEFKDVVACVVVDDGLS